MISQINDGLRIRNLWFSNGKIRCLDCGKIIGMGFEFYSVFQDGVKVGTTHSKDKSCQETIEAKFR